MLSGLQHAVRPASLRWSVVACAMIGGMALYTPCRAEQSGVALHVIYDLPSAARSNGPAVGQVTVDQSASPVIGPRPTLEMRNVETRFRMIELPPDVVSVPGTSRRPHHAVGYRWSAAESWLRDHGFDAQTCYLPLMRLHTKVNAQGASGTLWVYGRCTFK